MSLHAEVADYSLRYRMVKTPRGLNYLDPKDSASPEVVGSQNTESRAFQGPALHLRPNSCNRMSTGCIYPQTIQI